MDLKFVEEQRPACRVCGSTSVYKTGTRLDTENRLLSQQYRCKKCGTSFTAGKRHRMQKPDYIVGLCMALVRRGLYIKDVAAAVTEATGIHVHTASIGTWMKKYVPGYEPRLGRKPDPANKGKKYPGHYRSRKVPVDPRTVKGMKRQLRAMADKLEKAEREKGR